MNLRIINIALSISVICILFIDFFLTNEFNVERGFLDVFVLLLILNTFRLVVENKIRMITIGICLNLGLLGFLLFNIPIFSILIFGIGFTGRSFPLIMAVAIIINFWLIGVLISETIRLIRTKIQHN
ncbi:MAG: hypothetical protein COA33_013135 [Fluviicola sp.]|nr:hypothetical protein [Fluviicola sp.]